VETSKTASTAIIFLEDGIIEKFKMLHDTAYGLRDSESARQELAATWERFLAVSAET
jgi:hypothetical protein